MKLEMKITERDKKLLVFLAVFLIAAAFLLLVIMPGFDRAQELREEITASTQSKMEMDSKIAQLPNLEEQLGVMQKEWEAISEDLYPMMESQDIDKIVTDEVIAQGLTTKSMKITMNQDPVSLQPYLWKEKQEQQNQAAAAEASDGDGEAAEADSAAVDSGQEETSTGIYSAKVNLSVEGSREKIRRLMDRFVNEYTAVRVLSAKYDTEEVIDDAGLVQSTNTVLDLEMGFYMYEK